MWQLIFIIVCVELFPIDSQPIDQYEPSLWSSTSDGRSSVLDNLKTDTYDDRYAIYNRYQNDDILDLDALLQMRPLRVLPQKRGFSMLARWRPFNNIGKERTSIKNNFDIVSAEARGRPVGQPLRWG